MQSNNYDGCEFLLERGAIVNRDGGWAEFPSLLGLVISSRVRQERRLSEVVRFVELLLAYGANATQEILTTAATDVRGIGEALVRHVAKMEHLDLDIHEDVRRTIQGSEVYSLYYRRCFLELETMKRRKLYNNVSIFQILMGSEKMITGYARHEEVVGALEARDYNLTFPVYFTLLKKRFNAKVEEQALRDTAAKILSNIFMLNDPFHFIVQNVLNYPHIKDLCVLK